VFRIFLTTLRIGSFTFGGGWAMIPLIREELVKRRRWLSEEEFFDIVSIAQSFPGPIMVNVSVMCGRCLLGIRGAIAGLLGSILPSLVVVLIIVSMLTKFGERSYIKSFLRGMRPALFAVLVYALYSMRGSVRGSKVSMAIAILAFLSLSFLGINPFLVIAGGAVFGILFYILRERFS